MKGKNKFILIIVVLLIFFGLLFFFFRNSHKMKNYNESNKIELKIGDTYQLRTHSVTKNGKEESLLYSSSNPDIVEVDEETGYLIVKESGVAEITVFFASDSSVYRVYEITVLPEKDSVEIIEEKEKNSEKSTNEENQNKYEEKETSKASLSKNVSVIDVDINKTSTTLNLGSSEKLEVIIFPKDATNQNVTWKSSDTNIVSVSSNGTIRGMKEGTATITVATSDGSKKARIKVKVVVPKQSVTGIQLQKDIVELSIGASEKLVAIISPKNATNQAVTWKSSDDNIAFVDSNGVIIAKKTGEAIVTVTTNDGKLTAKATIKVKPVAVTGISLNKASMNLFIGSTEKLVATISPSNATNQNITWKSSDTSIASVSTVGNVKGNKQGTATITATTEDGAKVAKVTVTVIPVPVDSVSLNRTSGTIYLNSSNLTTTLTATVLPSNAADKTVTWKSSNTSVATVSSAGVVTAKSPGEATITATSGGKKATYTLTVMRKHIVIIGASQVKRMAQVVNSYDVESRHYGTDTNTLKIIYQGSTGFAYQVGEGWSVATTYMKEYESLKKYIEFYIYFPMPGNDILKFSCDQITTSNATIKKYMSNFNTVIQNVKDQSYNIKAYVVSVQPVKPTEAHNEYVVSNTNANSCTAKYRSNVKYYTFNKVTKELLNSYNNLNYVETFTKIMKVNENGGAFSYKVSYKTNNDGIHWDDATTAMYVQYMLESNSDL